MADNKPETSGREVSCPRCGARTRRGITRLGRVCEDCSRRVFTIPLAATNLPFGNAETDRLASTSDVIVPLVVFAVLVAVTWTVAGDGLSTFDPIVLVAGWGTFVVWGLAPSGSGSENYRFLDRLWE